MFYQFKKLLYHFNSIKDLHFKLMNINLLCRREFLLSLSKIFWMRKIYIQPGEGLLWTLSRADQVFQFQRTIG